MPAARLALAVTVLFALLKMRLLTLSLTSDRVVSGVVLMVKTSSAP